MGRMFGFIGNRADLGARVLEIHAAVLRVRTEPGEPLGWGVGFYQSGEVLLRRRPLDDRPVVDMSEAAEKVRTDALLGHVRRATVGGLRTENTHPFRYRSWLFAQTGTIQGFEHLRPRLFESLPEFLRRNVRGDTDSELFFHLFLSFLHDAGALGDGAAQPLQVATALRSSIALVDRLSAEEGFPENSGDVMVTNGEQMFAVHRNGSMAYRVIKGRHDVDELLGEEARLHTRIPAVESTHFTIVATELENTPQGWTAVPTPSIVTLTRTDDPVTEPL
jgi:predicted glutamine amidotransferase